ncbi:hypothetical protein IV203_033166 [Nitzschia inconspicua]|uniref:Uncharacterized protein n=1 Tax=Nitzschia inconspicua TaxID=303405 RepID=A0A9K3KL15_9STRA|nr:hypothetical protein IV203_033166 [Nitzschia inconspicua]
MSSILTPNYPPPARKSKDEMIQDLTQMSGSSFLTPNYPPPKRKTKEEMIEDLSQKSGSSFLTPNYPPPKRKAKEEMIAEAQVYSSSRKSKEEMNQDLSQVSGSSFLTPNYPPPKRKTKEEMIAEAQGHSSPRHSKVEPSQNISQKSGSSFLTPNYPPPKRKTKEEMITEGQGYSLARMSKDEMTQDLSQKSGSSFLTPNYPPPKRKTKEEMIAEAKRNFNWKVFLTVVCILVIALGVTIGILVSRNKDTDTSDDAAATSAANSTSSASTNDPIDLDCEMKTIEFSDSNLVLTMSVDSGISSIEMEYAAAVFEKTYTSMLANELSASLNEYCDPYCRQITGLTVLSNELISPEESADSRQSSDCDATLKLVMGIEGTFVGCEDTPFPGLFSAGRRQLIQIQRSKVRMNLNTPRFLQPGAEGTEMDPMCPSCPDDSNSLGLQAPAVPSMVEILDGFVSVLPAICELTDAEIVET